MKGAKFDGKPCRHHPDNTMRYVSNGGCVVCLSTRATADRPQHVKQQNKAKRQTLIKRAIQQFESW